MSEAKLSEFEKDLIRKLVQFRLERNMPPTTYMCPFELLPEFKAFAATEGYQVSFRPSEGNAIPCWIWTRGQLSL